MAQRRNERRQMDLKDISKGGNLKPPRILIYGQAGIGKTTFGAQAPKPIFLPIEDGLGKIEADSFPQPATFDEVLKALDVLIRETHSYKTVVVDSLDWLETLIWEHTCNKGNYATIEQPGYGRGYVEALRYWREFLDRLNLLRDQKGMQSITVCHSIIREFKSPDTDSYDRYQIKLQQKASDLVCEHSDCIFFADFKKSTIKTEGRGGQRTRAVGTGDRVMYTEERPSWLAKNRYGMDPEMELSYQSVIKALKPKEKKDV